MNNEGAIFVLKTLRDARMGAVNDEALTMAIAALEKAVSPFEGYTAEECLQKITAYEAAKKTMTDTEKLISDLKHHSDAFKTGVAFTDVSAMSTVDVLERAIEFAEKGYVDEETDRTE